MKKGWLIVNAFLTAEKYATMYALLQNAASKLGVSLVLKTTADLTCAVGDEASLFIENKPDFVLFWDKDVSLARRLEKTGVPLFNSATAIEVCDNKIMTAERLQQADVPTPDTVIAPKTFENIGYSDFHFLKKAGERLGYPMVIKEAYGSFGAQVYLAETEGQAKQILQKIGHKDCLMQRFIGESAGRDIRVNVVGDKVVCAMLRENENDFRSNISGGGKASAVTLTEEQEKLAIDACKALSLDFAGVDILLGRDKDLVCEVNSNPHFKSALDCTGVDVSECILRYIKEDI